jgi:hypothetical protein
VYLAPIFVGLLLSSGLLSALLSEGLGRYFSWISVGSPLMICLWFYLQRFCGEKKQQTNLYLAERRRIRRRISH